MNPKMIFVGLSLATVAGPASAYDPPAFPLNDSQLKAFEQYETAKGIKAFAAGPEGQYYAQAGFAGAPASVPCFIVHLDGALVPLEQLKAKPDLSVDGPKSQ